MFPASMFPASIFQAPRVQEECLNFMYVEAGLGTPVLISLLVNC